MKAISGRVSLRPDPFRRLLVAAAVPSGGAFRALVIIAFCMVANPFNSDDRPPLGTAAATN